MNARTLALLVVSLLSAALLALAPRPAHAQAKARLHVLVAHTSMDGKKVDPRVSHLAQDFHLAFTNYSVVDEKTLEVEPGKSASVALPSGKSVEIQLVKREGDNTAHLKVTAPGRGTMETKVPPRQSVTLDVGDHNNGKLWVVIEN